MSILSQPPKNYQIYNSEQAKKLAIVVDIEGLDYLTSTTIGRVIRYGDPISYGDPGIIYGGLVPVGFNPGERGQKVLLSLDGASLTISQRLEPEQGRGSISTLSMTFIDKDQYMTQAISSGVIIDEILGKEVRIWIGYAQTSFPEDYYVIWRGRVAQVMPEIGRVSLQFTDPNIVRRQNVFYQAQTTLFGDITDSQTTISVASNGDFHKKILGPDGIYDQSIKLYFKIEDEYIEYQQSGFESSGFGTNQFLNVVRGSRNTTPSTHPDQTQVDAYLEISGHAMDIALKLQLSGWNGPYKDDQTIYGIVLTGDPDTPIVNQSITLPSNVDAIRDLGLSVGDFITISGDTVPANNIQCIVQGFQDLGVQTNRVVLVDQSLTANAPSPAVLALRSKYDTYPVSCGVAMPAWEVDVAGHEFYKNTYLLGAQNSYRFFITEEDSAKTFIENQIMLPLGAYSLTRQGKASMGLTKPAIADERTTVLDSSNIIDPQTIKIQRGLNNRKFFNEIDWEFDFDDDGNPTNVRKTINVDSLNSIGLASALPIQSQGSRTNLGFLTIVEKRERFLLQRYARAAVIITLKSNFGAGNQIESGDIVILKDNGELQIPNMVTGERDIGEQMFEIINRSLDMKTGQVSLDLLGGVESLISDRFATISPSSLVDTGSTTSVIRIKESFGNLYPLQEQKKWSDYVGLNIRIRSPDYTTRYQEVIFTAFDPSDDHAMLISPALPFSPQIDDIVELAPYPDNTDRFDQSFAKLVHVFLDPTVDVVSGIDGFNFTVAPGDVAKFHVGAEVLVHNADYSNFSPEVHVLSVTGSQITVDADLGFTPSPGDQAELIGFGDFDFSAGSGGAYRFI